VSTDSVEDGQQIVRLQKDDFANVQLSMQPERATADFEECLPDVRLARTGLDPYRSRATCKSRPRRCQWSPNGH
jgi:hypothetical protein